jgi:hypothetical protein
MLNDRSVYPDLAHWTQSTEVLLMTLLGGVYTFFGPIVGALLLRTMDADITQNYPEIWQLFLGGVLVMILFGLPGGIVGFIQERDVKSADDQAARTAKMLRLFRRKSWMFFAGALLFTTFFNLLQSPGAWLFANGRELGLGIVPCALLQLLLGGGILWLLLRRAERFVRIEGGLLLALPIAAFALHVWLGTPLSGLLVVLLWIVFTVYSLAQPEFRRAYRLGG